MTTYTVTLISPVVGDGTPVTNPYRPKFSDDHPDLGYSDVTGLATEAQPGDPSEVTITVITSNPDALHSDPDIVILEEVENAEEPI